MLKAIVPLLAPQLFGNYRAFHAASSRESFASATLGGRLRQPNIPRVHHCRTVAPTCRADCRSTCSLCESTGLPAIWSLLISFCGATLRNECSITSNAQLMQLKRTLIIESGKFAARYCDALQTTRNAASRRAWRRNGGDSRQMMWCQLVQHKTAHVSYQYYHISFICSWL